MSGIVAWFEKINHVTKMCHSDVQMGGSMEHHRKTGVNGIGLQRVVNDPPPITNCC